MLRLAFTLLLVIASLQTGLTQTNPSDLLPKLPGPFNTATVVNVEAILQSPRGKKEGWDKLEGTNYLAGAIPVNPGIERIVAVTELAPGRGRGEMAAIVPTKIPVNMETIAKSLQASPVTIGQEQAIVTATGSYLLKIDDKTLGLMRTTQRQDVSRWVQAKREKTLPKPNRYLSGAVASEGRSSHFFIAVDVDDLFDKEDVVRALAVSTVLDQDKKARETVTKFLASMKGVRLYGNFTANGTELKMVMDGTLLPTVPAEVYKEVVIELLENARISFTDLRASTPKNEQDNFSLTLKINDDELGYLMSLVLPPISADIEASSTISATAAGPNREATIKYLTKVNGILDELKKKIEKANDSYQTALWHETAVRQIQAISILGVEKVVVEYAFGTCDVLHSIAESFLGTPIKLATLQGDAYLITQRQPMMFWSPFGGMQWNPWAYSSPNVATNLPEIRRKQADAIRKDTESRVKLWQMIDSKRSETLKAVGSNPK
ncbi:MAG: hypothetical protein ACRC8S_22140 [Fimbriiglobus sp.]